MVHIATPCRYDSEEERVKERLEQLDIKRRQNAQAARESAILEEYRATLHARRQYWIPTSIGDDQHVRHSPEGRGIIEEHLQAWSAFEQMYSDLIKNQGDNDEKHILVYDDVPWIPKEISKLQYLKHVSEVRYGHDMKKAYASICLTWHPDKFQNKFMRFFRDLEWNVVVSTVNEIFQEFRDAWGHQEHMMSSQHS